ncbi:MAG: XRE family transcriptional regulator [Planctomycetota bacterium]
MGDHVNPDMLAIAREGRGFTQSGLADQIGISQSKYSKYESGNLVVSDEDLSSIARVLDFPAGFFCQSDAVYGFASPVFYHRKRARLSVGSLRVIQARLNIFRFHVNRLIRGVEVETPFDLPVMDVDSYDSPEDIARKVRLAWRLPMGPVASLVAAIESAGAVLHKTLLNSNHIDAVVQVAPGSPQVAFINETIPGDRLRFTLAHELGHLIMHQHPSPDMEREADRFAAELLMPEDEIKHQLRGLSLHKLPDLKMQWRVSMAAIVMRAGNLGQITQRHSRTLFAQLAKNGWRKVEPYPIPVETPTVFQDMVNTYLGAYRHTIAELCKLLNATEGSFRREYLETGSSGLRVVS